MAWQYYAPALAFAVALVLLGLTAAREGAVPMWTGRVLAIGGVVAGTEGIVVSNAYFIAGAVVLLLGSGAVGLAVGRMSDEEFAGYAAARSSSGAGLGSPANSGGAIRR